MYKNKQLYMQLSIFIYLYKKTNIHGKSVSVKTCKQGAFRGAIHLQQENNQKSIRRKKLVKNESLSVVWNQGASCFCLVIAAFGSFLRYSFSWELKDILVIRNLDTHEACTY